MNRLLVTAALSCLFTLSFGQAHAITWDGGGDGVRWLDDANWDPDGQPTTNDTVDIFVDGTEVVIDGPAEAFRVRLTDDPTDTVTLTITNGGTLILNDPFGSDDTAVSNSTAVINIYDGGTLDSGLDEGCTLQGHLTVNQFGGTVRNVTRMRTAVDYTLSGGSFTPGPRVPSFPVNFGVGAPGSSLIVTNDGILVFTVYGNETNVTILVGNDTYVAMAGGTLAIEIAPGYVPQVGHTYDVIGANNNATIVMGDGSNIASNTFDGSYVVEWNVGQFAPGGAAKGQITVVSVATFLPMDEPPILTLTPDVTNVQASAGDTIQIDVVATQVEGDTNDTTTLEATGLPGGATFTPNPNTGLSPLTNTFLWTPAAGQTGITEVTFSASDEDGTNEVTVAFEIFPANEPPALAIVPAGTNKSANVGQLFTFDVTATQVPGDSNQVTTLEATGLPVGASVTPNPASGTAPLSVALSWTPGAAQTGLVSVTFTASDVDGTNAVTVDIHVVASSGLGSNLQVFSLGNSLTLGLSQPRLRGLFQSVGGEYLYGAQLAANAALNEHWTQVRNSGDPMNIGTGVENFLPQFTNVYQEALQQFTFDAVILQPHLQWLDDEPDELAVDTNRIGDVHAASNFIAYALGENPATNVASQRFFIYGTWPTLLSVHYRNPNTTGSLTTQTNYGDSYTGFTFKDFWESPYTGYGEGTHTFTFQARQTVPNRNFLTQLVSRLNQAFPNLPQPVRLVPAGDVLARMDEDIRNGLVPGIEAYFLRNSNYYITARADYTPGPGFPIALSNYYDQAYGVFNFYCDGIHFNDQPHAGAEDGTIGAYVSALTMYATISGNSPVGLPVTDYTRFDPVADSNLVLYLQETVWDVVTSDPYTGIGDLTTDPTTGFGDYQSFHFTPAEQGDPNLSGAEADFDDDGWFNLLEYFFQRNPKVPETVSPLSLTMNGSSMVIGYDALLTPADMSTVWEMTENLLDPSWSNAAPVITAVQTNGALGSFEATFTLDVGPDQRAYRLRATQP